MSKVARIRGYDNRQKDRETSLPGSFIGVALMAKLDENSLGIGQIADIKNKKG